MTTLSRVFTGIGIGAVVALLVHELFEHGVDLSAWSVRGAQTGRVIITGAVIGAVSQFIGGSAGRR